MTCEDQRRATATTNQTLETQPSGAAVAWSNPDSGNHGTVTPVRSYQQANGTYCREFEETVTVNGKSQTGYGTACRQPDGVWKIQEQ